MLREAPVVARTTEDLVREPKLLQVREPLELPRVVYFRSQRRQVEVAVHRVIKVLHTRRRGVG